ncbi:MAG: ABC transporter permease, partial [Chthoniobacterales bacterium]
MNGETDMTAPSVAGSGAIVSPATTRPRPFYWSVRRELWENRSIYVAPLIVAAIEIIGFAISAVGLPARRRAVLLLDPARQRHAIEQPYDAAAGMMMLTILIVGVFYCLDALHAERRERSILFWKSMPVSDLTTALSKLTVPMIVLPVIAFLLSICVHLAIALLTSILLLLHAMSPASTWMAVPFIQNWVVLLYGLVVVTLWYAPVYGWAMLVSAWARRATFLWAVLPFLAASAFERIAFGTSYFASLIRQRLFGFAADAFDFSGRGHPSVDVLSQLTPGRYLGTPGLWLGLLLAAA